MTTEAELLRIVAEVVAEEVGVAAADVRPSARLADLDIDDLSMVAIVIDLQERLGVMISDDDVGSILDATGGHVGGPDAPPGPEVTSREVLQLSSMFMDFDSRGRTAPDIGTVQDLVVYLMAKLSDEPPG